MYHQMEMKKQLVLGLLFITSMLISFSAFGQSLRSVKGVVVDKLSKETLIGVDVYWAKNKGITTDFDGKFSLEIPKNQDSLHFNYLGYRKKSIRINPTDTFITVEMIESTTALEEVVVVPDYSFDELVMRRVLKAKRKNNPKPFSDIYYEMEEMQVFRSNLKVADEDLQDTDNAYLPESDSTYMLPVMFRNKTSEFTRDGSPKGKILENEMEIIAPNIKSVINEFVGDRMNEETNFYENTVVVLGKAFPSPLSSTYKLNYRIYLIDSLHTALGETVYQFDFYPLNSKIVAFKGSFWINKSDYGLSHIVASVPPNSNINFIEDYTIEYDYTKNAKNEYSVTNTKISTSMALEIMGVSTSFRSFTNKVVSENITSSKSSQTQGEVVELINEKTNKNKEVKVKKRKKLFLRKNKGTKRIKMFKHKLLKKKINTYKKDIKVRAINYLSAVSLTGYFPMGLIDIGPFFDIYTRNAIEGSRLTLPLRTSPKLSEKFSVGGFLGYGIKNKKFKYGIRLDFLLPTRKRSELRLTASDDFHFLSSNKFQEFIQENPFSKGGGNILSIFNSASRNRYMVRKQYISLNYYNEINKNASIIIRPFIEKFHSNTLNPFKRGDLNFESLTNKSVLLDFRYSKSTNFDQQHFQRFYYGSRKPVYHLTTILGKTNVSGEKSHFYGHINLSYKQKFYAGPFVIKSYADVGIVIGRSSFLHVSSPQSISGIAMGRYSYNLLNLYSVTSNFYSNVHMMANGGGFLLNRIPLINKLKWREVLSFKMYNGFNNKLAKNLIDPHQSTVKMPNKPYMELGVGVANIFKLLHLEYVFRLNRDKRFNQISNKGMIKFRIAVAF